jgi:uncharacterized membrane protein
MPFCTNCGTQTSGGFCPNCGTPLASGAPAGGGAAAGMTNGAVPQQGLSTNAAGALCYLLGLITGIIFLVLAPYNQNKTIRFHAFQSIFLNLGLVVFYILWGILTFVLAFITHGFAFLLYPLIGLAVFALWLYMMFATYNGKRVKLPIIGDLAEKQA